MAEIMINDFDPTECKGYWKELRNKAAIAAMHTIAQSLGSIDYNKELIVKHAVELADVLVEELKGGNND